MSTTPKTIGQVTALIPEASTANDAFERIDGKSGDTAFPYAKFKILATVGEIDPVTKKALTGYPDGNAAWLKDNDTVRVAYQSESYATIYSGDPIGYSGQTYGWEMSSGVKFTGSHIHTIDYDRAKFADFLDNGSSASEMFKTSGNLFNKVYNVFGQEVAKKNTTKTDLAAKWGNQTNPDGTLVEFIAGSAASGTTAAVKDMRLTEGDFFFHSFCGSWYEPANKYGNEIGFKDDIWLMGEEWNIGADMFPDPDGTGPLTGTDVANGTMGLASMVVDTKNGVAYTAPALGQSGYEKLMPINPGNKDFVVIVGAGYNHDMGNAPLKVYVGRKGLDAAGNAITDSANARDKFLANNGLLYGQLYGMAASAATYQTLGITTVDADARMFDAYLTNQAAPANFDARFYPTTYRWNGFDTPEAVKDTETMLWRQDGDVLKAKTETTAEVKENNLQPIGYTYFTSNTKVEHPSADPDITKSRYFQNHTATGALVAVDFTSTILADLNLTNNDKDNNKLPDYLSAKVIRTLAGVDGALKVDVGGKGVAHFDATVNPAGAKTAAIHVEKNKSQLISPDGLTWIKSSDVDLLIVDEDSGNDYGERKIALVVNPTTLNVTPDGTGYFIAQAGGSKNPRATDKVATMEGTFMVPYSSEFSGSWDVTALVARKDNGGFYSAEELKGGGAQIVEQSRPLSEHLFIGVVQQSGESAGQVAQQKADSGGQIFQFSLDLPNVAPKPVLGTTGDDKLLVADASKGAAMIMNTIITGAGNDEVEIAANRGFENKIFSGSGVDTIFAGTRDVITGGSGNDELYANGGNGNRLSGGTGNDNFYLGSSGNRALGGDGNDVFNVGGEAGTNYLNGGAGVDQFWLVSGSKDLPAAKQFVMDFTPGEDKVGLRGYSFADLSFTQAGSDTLLTIASTAVGHFSNTSASALNNVNNFAF